MKIFSHDLHFFSLFSLFLVVDSPNKNTHNNTLNEENEMMKSNTDDGGGAEEKMTTTTREVEEEEKEDQKDEKEETETTMLSREAKEIDVFVEKIVKVNGVFLREIQKSSSSKEEDLEEEEEEEDAFQAIIKRVNKYQEKCEMLDRHLEKWIVPLTEEVLRFHAVKMSNHVFDDDETKNTSSKAISALAMHQTSKVLHAFATVRGAKTIARFFPHSARDLEPAIKTLRRFMPKRDGSAAKYEVAGFWDRYQPGTRETLTEEVASESLFETSWETRATLLSWISVLVLMPFDMKTFVKTTTTTFDNSAEGGVGGGSSSNSSSGDENKAGLIEDLLGMCRQCVSFAEVARDRAAICVARLLTRPDAELNLGEYLDWSSSELMRVFGRKKAGEEESTKDKIAEAVAASEDSFVAVGATRSMAAIFKIGRRDVLKPFRESALKASQAVFDAKTPLASSSFGSRTTTSNALTRQLACKLSARVALTLLAPKVVSWRYARGSRNLAENLLNNENANTKEEESVDIVDDNTDDNGFAADDETDEASLDQLEKAIDLLLEALKDTDTIVRWSAAKGIGRICQRLPKQFADDVVENLLSSCFKATESESTWHGACLALAELSRRGVLLVTRLPFAAEKTAAALLYDVRRGSHSVGAHVRDAAAYVCWSFARAYSKSDFQEVFLGSLATPLLVTSCFDREVNVRRAASAAFQECVGRLGGGGGIVAKQGEEDVTGIDIVQKCDYFTIGSARRAYLDVGFFISQSFPAFRPAMLAHILDVKIEHWEESTRCLAVETLGALGETDVEWTSTVALPKLLRMSVDMDLPKRHGATLGVAQLLLSKSVIEYLRNENANNIDTLRNAWNLVSEIEAKRLYRGKGGEIMRGAVCNVIESLGRVATLPSSSTSPSEFFKPGKQLIVQLCESATSESLRHPKKEIREAAAKALVSIASSSALRVDGNESIVEATLAEQYLVTDRLRIVQQTMDESSSFSRRGSAYALGIVPDVFINSSNWRAILTSLLEATVPEDNPEMRDAETRVDAVIASQNILCKINAKYSASSACGEKDDVISISDLKDAADMCLEAFLKGVEDYSVDKRGDVGSWVREASMRAFSEVLRCFQTISKCSDDSDGVVVDEYETKCTTILGVLLKQCGEKIDRTRTVAFESLFALLRGTGGGGGGGDDDDDSHVFVSNAKDFESIQACVPVDAKDVSSEAGLQRVFSHCLTKAVLVAPYADYALSGWVASTGAVTESLAKAASTALLSVLSKEDERVDLKEKVATHLIETFDAYSKIDRVTVPAIRCVDVLFTGGAFDSFSLTIKTPDGASKDYKTALSDRIRFECAGTRDVSKYILAANALSHVASCTDSVEAKESARLGLLAMMRNKFPRVRQIASEVLHMALSSEDDVDANTEEVMGMLTARFWEATMNAEMKEAIHVIYAKLGLEIPKQTTGKKDALKTITEENIVPGVLASSKVPTTHAKKIGDTADENSSYQSLVEFSGR